MPDKAFLIYICSWSHGSLHVYSFVRGLGLGSYEWVWLVDIFVLPMGLQTPSAPSVFLLTLIEEKVGRASNTSAQKIF